MNSSDTTTTSSDTVIYDLVLEADTLAQNLKNAEALYAEARAKVLKAMQDAGQDTLSYESNGRVVSATITTRNTPQYDVKVLHKLLPADIFRQITEVSINNKALTTMHENGKISIDIIDQACVRIGTTTYVTIKGTKSK